MGTTINVAIGDVRKSIQSCDLNQLVSHGTHMLHNETLKISDDIETAHKIDNNQQMINKDPLKIRRIL